ncbi:hypothetical protein SAMN05920897_12041, partial [Alkalispirochaeta americana]
MVRRAGMEKKSIMVALVSIVALVAAGGNESGPYRGHPVGGLAVHRQLAESEAAEIKGSSSNSGECVTDAKEEIFVVPEAIGDPFDHL